MAQTYTTQFFDVSNGDTTTHNPQSLAPTTTDIKVLDAEIQWEGVTSSSGNTTTSSNTNSDTATATTSTNRTTSTNTNSDSATATTSTSTTTKDNSNASGTSGTGTISASYPSVPSGTSFTQHEVVGSLGNGDSNTVEVAYTYEDADGNNVSTNSTLSPGETITPFSDTTTTKQVGQSRAFAIQTISGASSNSNINSGIEVFTFGEDTTTTVNSRTASASYPSVPSGFSFDKHVVKKFENGSRINKTTFFSQRSGSESITSNDPNTTVEVEIETIGEDFNTTVNSRTASVSYPSVPSGTTFDKHVVKKFENGSRVDTTTYFSQQSGSESITSNDPNTTVEVEIKTVGEDTTTFTDTRNPSVSGDISASYTSGDIADGVTTNFISLSGLTADSETFEHTIDGSGEARFRFRFSFEKILPDPTNGTVAFADTSKGVFHEVAVADPTDDALDYNHVQIYNASTDNWGALDVVNVSDTDALEQFAFYDSNAGWLAPRERSTTPI